MGELGRTPPGALRQWCPVCQAATEGKPCPECGAPWFGCIVCGHHDGHIADDDDE